MICHKLPIIQEVLIEQATSEWLDSLEDNLS